jgi:hypothetical protein
MSLNSFMRCYVIFLVFQWPIFGGKIISVHYCRNLCINHLKLLYVYMYKEIKADITNENKIIIGCIQSCCISESFVNFCVIDAHGLKIQGRGVPDVFCQNP